MSRKRRLAVAGVVVGLVAVLTLIAVAIFGGRSDRARAVAHQLQDRGTAVATSTMLAVTTTLEPVSTEDPGPSPAASEPAAAIAPSQGPSVSQAAAPPTFQHSVPTRAPIDPTMPLCTPTTTAPTGCVTSR
jgi:hypothetical protein